MANFTDWVGRDVFDKDGRKVGSIADLYMDDDSTNPDWATIKSGLFGTKRHFVPVSLLRDDRDELVIDATEDAIKAAPGIEDEATLTYDEEVRLRKHYAKADDDQVIDEDAQDGTDRRDSQDRDRDGFTDRDRSEDRNQEHNGDRRDDRTSRDEDFRRDVTHGAGSGASSAAAGAAGAASGATNQHGQPRLRRYVVTENVQVSVPVQREVVELEDESSRPGDKHSDSRDRD